MEIPPAEVIDKTSIIRLKIERIGEPHLKEAYERYKDVLDRYKKNNITIKEEWFDKLYEINKKIWDLDFEIRDLVNKQEENLDKEKLERIGKNSLSILEFMKDRVAIKNKIVEETGKGFKEIKINHPSV